MRHKTCNVQHATGDMRRATFDLRHATCDTQHATCDTRHATLDMRHSVQFQARLNVECSLSKHGRAEALDSPLATWRQSGQAIEAFLGESDYCQRFKQRVMRRCARSSVLHMRTDVRARAAHAHLCAHEYVLCCRFMTSMCVPCACACAQLMCARIIQSDLVCV